MFKFFALLPILLFLVTACASDEDERLSLSLQEAALNAEETKDYQVAASHYKKLFEREPENLEALLSLSRVLRYLGASSNANTVLDQSDPKFANNPAFQIELGKARLSAGHIEAALDILEKVTGKSTNNWQAYSTLGIAYDSLEKYGEARTAYGKALKISPDNPAVLNNMGMSLAQSGSIDLGIKTLKKALKASYNNSRIRQNLSLLYGIKGDMNTARALAKMDLNEKKVQHNLTFFKNFQK